MIREIIETLKLKDTEAETRCPCQEDKEVTKELDNLIRTTTGPSVSITCRLRRLWVKYDREARKLFIRHFK